MLIHPDFSSLPALAGGAMIGAAAVLLLALEGRLAGVSTMLASLLPPKPASDWANRFAFLGGLVAAPMIATTLLGLEIPATVTSNSAILLIGGLLVGFGTVWGYGCTSGHGVCGLSRLSRRSLVATAVFMAAAMATVFVTRHVIGG